MLKKFSLASLQVPPVVPFGDGIVTLDEKVDEDIKRELKVSLEALDRPGAYERVLIGFEPLPE